MSTSSIEINLQYSWECPDTCGQHDKNKTSKFCGLFSVFRRSKRVMEISRPYNIKVRNGIYKQSVQSESSGLNGIEKAAKEMQALATQLKLNPFKSTDSSNS